MKVVPPFLALVLALVFASPAPAAQSHEDLYKEAERAWKAKDGPRADFYAARYLGLTGDRARIDALVATRPLAPTAFLSAAYDAGFLDWFQDAMLPLWGRPEEHVRERYGSVELRTARHGKYFAVVTAYPKLEAWFTAGEGGSTERRLLVATGSSAQGRRATLIAGEYVQARGAVPFKPVEINTQGHSLQYVWEPEFDDLDGDGTPELWLRYDLTWGNGFRQFLDVYRLKGRELARVHRFEAADEGVALRAGPGRVETFRGAGSDSGLSHFEYDVHRVIEWAWENGAFAKKSEREVPHLLRSGEWKKYFAETSS